MGLFCANLHFRQSEEAGVRAALNRRGIDGYRLLPATGGWTSLYEERCSQQDEDWIRELTGEIAQELHAAGIAFMVHDSDIACYWLFDHGKLIDEYNSCPDYFDFDADGGEPSGPRGGRPEILMRYCRSGVREEQLASILTKETTFAESVIERLADALGIDPDRALGDYLHDDDGPESFDGFGGDDDEPGGDVGFPRANRSALKALTGRLAQMFGSRSPGATADPQAVALVQAAASGDVEGITRLVSEGAAVDAEAPAPLPAGQPMAGLGQVFPGGVPQIAMTPLLTAVSHKEARAAEALLDAGADPNRVHPLFGTPIHAAAGSGDVKVLQLLIDRGGDVNARNAQGQTALQVLAASRSTLDRLAQAQDMIRSLGHAAPPIVEQLSKGALPTEGWDRCEKLLKEHGAR